MKRHLLFSILVFMGSILCAQAYETVVIKYPDGELWEPVYYKKLYSEAIAQYVPKGQTSKQWTKTIIIHSYANAYNAQALLERVSELNRRQNPTGAYYVVKKGTDDTIAARCSGKYKNLEPQCEILRASKGHNGLITIQYINKNVSEFKDTYDDWYTRIKKAIFYENYFRNDRVLNKSIYLEL